MKTKLFFTFLFMFLVFIGFSQMIIRPLAEQIPYQNTYAIYSIGDDDSEFLLQVAPASDYRILTGESFSIGAWVRFNTATGMFSYSNSGYTSWYQFYTSATGFTYNIQDYINSASATGTVSGGVDMDDGTWHHCIFVWKASVDTLYGYIDGIRKTSTYNATLDIIEETLFSRPFTMLGVSYEEYIGEMDDFFWTSSELTYQQVRDLYGSGKGDKVSYSGDVSQIISGVETWLPFNEGTGTLIEDFGSLGNDCTFEPANHTWMLHYGAMFENLAGAWKFSTQWISGTTIIDREFSNGDPATSANTPTLTTDQKGVSNSAMTFTAASGDWVDVSTLDGWHSGKDSLTIVAWVKTSTSQDNRMIAGWWYLQQTAMRIESNYMQFNVRSASGLCSTQSASTINDGEWHLYVGVYDSQETTECILYVDGYSEDTDASGGGALTASADKFNIGNNNDGTAYFDGTISHVMIYGRSWTAQEVLDYWNFSKP